MLRVRALSRKLFAWSSLTRGRNIAELCAGLRQIGLAGRRDFAGDFLRVPMEQGPRERLQQVTKIRQVLTARGWKAAPAGQQIRFVKGGLVLLLHADHEVSQYVMHIFSLEP